MKIIQLIDNNGIQGLGDDGKLYELTYVTSTFGRTDKQWLPADGCPSLAQHVADKLRYATRETVGRRVQKFADDIKAKALQEQNAVIDAVRYSISLANEHVHVIVKPECIIVAGSDDSRVQLDLIGTQYV